VIGSFVNRPSSRGSNRMENHRDVTKQRARLSLAIAGGSLPSPGLATATIVVARQFFAKQKPVSLSDQHVQL
ncbi:MAG: hypothetical protein ACE1Y9_04060, partial [Acidimicrobiia bacterium]